MPIEQGIYHQGSRIGVLLIHGLTGTPIEMDSIGLRLNKYGFTVSIPVLEGHCSDFDALIATDRRDWLKGLEQEYEKLAKVTDVIFVAGLSAGASMSMIMADKYPEIRGMALYSTTLQCDGWSVSKAAIFLPLILKIPMLRDRYRFVEAYPYGIKNELLRERIVMKLESGDSSAAGHTNTPGKILYEMFGLAEQAKKVMSHIKTPALIVHAEEDDLASMKNAIYVQEHLAGEAQLLRLHDSYHLVTIDQERQKVASATARFFYSHLSELERQELATAAARKIPSEKDDDTA